MKTTQSYEALKLAIGDRMHPVNGKQITFWVIEDNDFYRDLVQFHLDLESGLACTGAFNRCDRALEEYDASDNKPQVVLMDLGLPGLSGLAGIREFSQRKPRPFVLVLTVDESRARMAFDRGANGYLLKTTPLPELARYVRTMLGGGMPIDPMVAPQIVNANPGAAQTLSAYRITEREFEILELLMEALDSEEIANRLSISTFTARSHVAHILKKFGVNSRGALRVRVLREKLL